jgi:hypothetical protein
MTRFQRKKNKRSSRANGGMQWLASVYTFAPLNLAPMCGIFPGLF